MNWTKWLACTALAGGLLAGCGDSGGGTDMGGGTDGGTDTGTTMDMGTACTDPGATGMTKVYVVNVLQLPQPSGASSDIIDGFDLDHRVDTMPPGATCSQALDYTSPDYQGSMPGVDNALAPFLGGLANDSIQKSVDQASVVILLEVKGIDNFMNDDCVSVTAYLGKLPSGATAMHAGACPMESSMDATCRLAAGQTFDIDPNSFTDSGHTMPRIAFMSAKIQNGRLNAGPVDFPIALDFMGSALMLTIQQAQVSVGITDTALTQGVLGGKINDAQLLSTIAAIPSLCSYVGTVGPILNMYSDLDETPNPDGGMPTCASASIAISLGGVGATKGAVAAAPPPMDGGTGGVCMTDGGTSG